MKVKITKNLLMSFPKIPCNEAMKVVASLLPATISTEPEENIDISIKAINEYDTSTVCGDPNCYYDGCYRDMLPDLAWLFDEIARQSSLLKEERYRTDELISDYYSLRSECADLANPLEVTQLLSLIAAIKLEVNRQENNRKRSLRAHTKRSRRSKSRSG